ncbi:unnamed protein product [Paramecium pentaurelia]|uniref:GAF domain-containing protein n=1 Tax=Paramecium pentaurelia TaxID=43138 RepID=A0A8S1V1G0_9CILI|nr:unnamed protein product [Paramecium pentaurelia]
MQTSDNAKPSRKGLGLLLNQHHRQHFSEDFQRPQQLGTPRSYMQALPKMSTQFNSVSTTNSNTRKLISAERPTITIAEEQDSYGYRQQDHLDEEILRIREIHEILKSRCSTLDLLISVIGGKEFVHNIKNQTTLQKIQELLKSISQTLQQSAKTEIELGFKMREIERKNIKYSSLQMKQLKLSDKNQSLQSVIDVHSQKTNKLLDENSKLQKQLKQERKLNASNSKKITALEKRIEFLLENDVNSALNPNDKLRSSLNELLKENELIKREFEHKKQELDRVQGKLNQYTQLVNRLQKTIDNMRKKNQDDMGKDEKSVFRKDDIDLLVNFRIPQTLDFRVVSQRLNNQHLLNDLTDKGVLATSQHNFTLPVESQKEQFQIIAQQLLSYKEFAEKMNQFFFYMEQFSKCILFEDIIHQVNRVLPQVFGCEQVRLWLIDGMNGTIFTYLETGNQIRALQHKGQVADVFKLRAAQNISQASQKPLLYRINESEQADYARNALLLPLFCETNDAIRGVLEVTNTENEFFSFDEEYFGILASHQLGHLLQRLIDNQSWLITQKYRGMMMDGFTNLMKSQSKQEFSSKVQLSLSQIFGFSQVLFYFFEDNQLVDYSNQDVKKYNVQYGLAGMVAHTKQKLIINDVKNSIHFNQAVDIKSILPIFAQPLLDKNNNTVAVIETCLKCKLKVQVEKDQLLSPSEGVLGMEEPLTKQLANFVDIIVAALCNIRF